MGGVGSELELEPGFKWLRTPTWKDGFSTTGVGCQAPGRENGKSVVVEVKERLSGAEKSLEEMPGETQ